MNKYHNTKITIDNVTFDSKAEAAMYAELKLLEKAGKIKNLTLQPFFILQSAFTNAHGKSIRDISYRADFGFFDCDQGRYRIIDCKGFKTEVYRLKKKLLDFVLKEQNLYLEEEI